MGRGQVSNEFIVLLGVCILLVLSVLYGISENMQSLVLKKEKHAIRDIGYFVQNELFSAAQAKDSYSREFELPQKHNSVDYTISIVSGYLEITAARTGAYTEFRLPKVTGDIQKGKNTVRKEGGAVYLN